jgi:hypothetical protein
MGPRGMGYSHVAGGMGSYFDVVGRLFGCYFGSNGHGGDDSEVARGLIDVLGTFVCTTESTRWRPRTHNTAFLASQSHFLILPPCDRNANIERRLVILFRIVDSNDGRRVNG